MDISIVIPTYNRRDLLARTLRSIANAAGTDNGIEVIVSDDGSSDDTFSTTIRAFERSLRLRYVYAPDEGFQAARARNLGIALARGSICIVCDSGNVVDIDFFNAHARAHARHPNAYAIGTVFGIYQHNERLEDLSGRLDTSLTKTEFRLLVDEFGLVDERRDAYDACEGDLTRLSAPWALAWGANLSFPTRLWHDVGGYDEAYKSWGVEDTDFALAMSTAGATPLWVSEAAVIHSPHEPSENAAQSNRANKQYLHRKYGLAETERLIDTTSIKLNLSSKVWPTTRPNHIQTNRGTQ